MTGKQGRWLGLPYDWRRPDRARLRESMWRPTDPRLFLPKAWGWGFSLNFHRVLHPFRRAEDSQSGGSGS